MDKNAQILHNLKMANIHFAGMMKVVSDAPWRNVTTDKMNVHIIRELGNNLTDSMVAAFKLKHNLPIA